MTSDPALAERLLPELPGWKAGQASLARGDAGDFLSRIYETRHARAFVEVEAGASAAAVVARTMTIPLGEQADGTVLRRSWMLQGRKADLLTERGVVHSLSLILRGGPGDLAGSVLLTIHGSGLMPDDAIGLACALDWGAITTALAGHHPFDAARVTAATRPSPDTLGAPHAPLLWPMIPSPASMERVARLEQRRPPRFAIANRDEVLPALGHDGTDQDRSGFAAMPTPILAITQRDFAPDYIWSGLHLASARMRNALALGHGAIEYREVDASGSAAAARAADYRAFHVVRQADPVDLARMYGHEPERGDDGQPTLAWLLSVSGPHAAPRRTIWREGFGPPAPLFRDGTGRLIATDALAERVMRAGLQDVVFQDVTSEAALHELVFRKATRQQDGDASPEPPD